MNLPSLEKTWMRWLHESATYNRSWESTQIPSGRLNSPGAVPAWPKLERKTGIEDEDENEDEGTAAEERRLNFCTRSTAPYSLTKTSLSEFTATARGSLN